MSFINKILPTSYLSEINYLIGEDRKKILYMGILFISISILDLIGIGIIGPYIALILDPTMADGLLSDIASFLSLPKGHSSLLISVGMLLISVFLLKLVLVLLAHKMIIKFSYQKMNNLREQLMSKYQSMPYNKYVQRSSSEYIYNIQTLTFQFTEDVLRPLLEIISSTLLVVSIFLLLAWLDPFALMIILSLMALIGLIYDRLTKNKMTAYGSKINIYSTLLIKGVQEGFDGLKEIRILNNESYFFNKVKVATRKYSNYKSKALVIVAIPRYLLETIMVVFLVLLVIFNIFGNKDMSSIFPTLAMFGLASFRLMPSVSSLLSGLLKLRHSRNSVSILFSDLSCIEGIDINKKIKHTASSLQFKSFSLNNVSYKYDSEKSMVLKSLSLVINSGECIGLIGSSGSGKTTLVDVILGLLRIKEGETLYNQEKMTKKLEKAIHLLNKENKKI